MDIEKAKEICKEIIKTNMFNRHTDAYAIETVLNELERLKKYENLEWQKFNELAVKDKIIELMAKEIAFITESCPFEMYDYGMNCENRCKHEIEEECWIEYFTNKAENVGE